MLTCKQCHMQYIGETKRSFRVRISEHLGDIRNKRNHKPVAKHYNSKNHTINCLKATILETITRDPELDSTTEVRRSRELFWIHRMRTLDPQGLNSMG